MSDGVPYFVERLDTILGPLDKSALLNAVSEGELLPGDAVFCDGRWSTIGEVLHLPRANRSGLALIYVLICGVGVLAFSLLDNPELFSAEYSIAVFVAVTVAGMLALGGSLWWIRRKISMPAGERLLIKTLAATSGLMTLGAGYASVDLAVAGVEERHVIATQWSPYIEVHAAISPGFANDLIAVMEGIQGPITLALKGLGGRAGEAERVAKFIRQRGDVTVRLTGECASACVTVFLSGQHRQSLIGGWIGVHRGRWARSGEELPDELQDRGENYLAGGLGALVAQANFETPAHEMAYFSPVLHAEQFSDVGIVSDIGRRMTTLESQVAFWEVQQTHTSSVLSGVTASVLEDFAEARPVLFQQLWPPFFNSLRHSNLVSQNLAAAALSRELESRALAVASPDLVRRYQHARARLSVANLAKSGQPPCTTTAIADDEGPTEFWTQLVADYEMSRDELIWAGAESKWADAPPSPNQHLDAALRSLNERSYWQETSPNDGSEASEMQRCKNEIAKAEVFEKLQAESLPLVAAALVLREGVALGQ